MSALREAAQQALEFIRAMNSHGWLLADYESDMERTVAGLEAALAQEQADPTDPGHDVDVLREHVRHLERRVRQLAQQQAAPVAWLDVARAIERAHGIGEQK